MILYVFNIYIYFDLYFLMFQIIRHPYHRKGQFAVFLGNLFTLLNIKGSNVWKSMVNGQIHNNVIKFKYDFKKKHFTCKDRSAGTD